MGCGPLRVSKANYPAKDCSSCEYKKEVASNPDPSRYKIIEYYEHSNNLLIKARYPNCENYEGIKILLYRNLTIQDLMSQKLIDPHFSDRTDYKSPFIRLEPTEQGWRMGVLICKTI